MTSSEYLSRKLKKRHIYDSAINGVQQSMGNTQVKEKFKKLAAGINKRNRGIKVCFVSTGQVL